MNKNGGCYIPPTPTPPNPIPSGKDGNEGSGLTWLWIVISCLVFIAVLLVLCCVRRRRKLAAHLAREEARLMILRDDEYNLGEDSELTKSDEKESTSTVTLSKKAIGDSFSDSISKST